MQIKESQQSAGGGQETRGKTKDKAELLRTRGLSGGQES